MEILGIDLSVFIGLIGLISAAIGAFVPKYEEAKNALKVIMDSIEDGSISQEEEKKIAKAIRPFTGETDVNIGLIGTIVGVLIKIAGIFVPKFGKIQRALKIIIDAIQDDKVTQEEEKKIVNALKAIF
jgi:hypothetical protein